ncbi:MAG: RNA-directed DNA polymerase [bacterium]
MDRRKGLPIGNQTSQFFANVYLNGFDHFVKKELGCRYYIRYVDDSVVLDDDKALLYDVREGLKEYLSKLRLRLHPDKSQIFPVEQGTDFLGYRSFPTHRLIRKSNVKRFRRKLRRYRRDYAAGELSWPEVNQRVQSWLGHACWANSYYLRKEIFESAVFVKG